MVVIGDQGHDARPLIRCRRSGFMDLTCETLYRLGWAGAEDNALVRGQYLFASEIADREVSGAVWGNRLLRAASSAGRNNMPDCDNRAFRPEKYGADPPCRKRVRAATPRIRMWPVSSQASTVWGAGNGPGHLSR